MNSTEHSITTVPVVKSSGSIKLIAFILAGLWVSTPVAAQSGLYIAPQANIFVHGGDTVGVFCDVTNDGNVGSEPGAVVRFMGLLWTNDSHATLPDENSYVAGSSVPASFTGTGGLFWFNNFAVSQNLPQSLSGGFHVDTRNGAAFPNLQIDNPQHVFLVASTDAQVRNTLSFVNGKLWLNNNNLLVGNNGPGAISGYTGDRYIVTGSGINGGYLYRRKINSASGTVVFPVGADGNFYTPAAILYKGTAQDFKVRSFNQVYDHAVTGSSGMTSFVQITWSIGKENNETAATRITLQHPQALEGSVFTTKRDSSYVTRYDHVKQVWDTVPASGVLTPGNLTTGATQAGTYVNARDFVTTLGMNEYFSKSVDYSPIQVKGDLSIGKEVINPFNPPYRIGMDVTYRITVTNKSNIDFTNVVVTDTLPAGLMLPKSLIAEKGLAAVDVNKKIIRWKPGAMNGNEETHLTMVCRIIEGGPLVNMATVTSFEPDANMANNIAVSSIEVEGFTLFIPNTFTPNGDGKNDRFIIGGLEKYPGSGIYIYNRWGGMVYQSKDYHNDWTGNGINEGTYFYILEVRTPDGKKIYKGWVEILR
ncbi:putative repeat protein (TIGR01451 family)/gliding motility-associated-like protein [Chitinophaga niastensis]|uniref:Putative repeat protein (TIGR01451 family)/gliding motility-associated-like protein n=1 Tax=Chitinophaga niastensis TaxID=536980 RepID=A0A2P8HA28_CHINA|nr:gliding motility-associated C-terminal domain-containing protein [Chitinophaga niastensis]PSL43075.1 putative repeat protein (TIGR01451 family)/gliding motility-associated-like protein [Chitinophaga niastensis]